MKKVMFLTLNLLSLICYSQCCNLPSIFFDYNSFKLKTEMISQLGVIANFLVENPQINIEVNGFDTVDSLSALKRAETSINFLIDVCSFERKRFVIKSTIQTDEQLKRQRENPRQLFDYINRRVDFWCINSE